MTLDEAIKHAEEVVKEMSYEYQECISVQDYITAEQCGECAQKQNQLAEWLKELKQLREQTRWIPVSERLPEKDESVLLTICANSSLYGFNENFVKVMCGSYSPCEDKRDWIVNEIRYYIDNVIAWMPLPESYKGE